MAEVLSQTEIDALLSAVSQGGVAAEKPPEKPAPKDWIAYDLASQEKIPKGKLAGLQGIHERLARSFQQVLKTRLSRNVYMHCANIEYLKFGEYLGNILLPTSIHWVSIKNLSGSLLVVTPAKVTYGLVDSYFGGKDRSATVVQGRQEFTSIEGEVLRKFISWLLPALETAWKPNYALEFEWVKSESNPQFITSIHGSEPVAVVTFDIEIDGDSSPLIVIVQLRALDPIQPYLTVNVTSQLGEELDRWKEHWARELSTLPLEVRVELGGLQTRLSEIRSWQVGDQILLEQDSAGPLKVSVQLLHKLSGWMGTYRGNNAVRLIGGLDETKEDMP